MWQVCIVIGNIGLVVGDDWLCSTLPRLEVIDIGLIGRDDGLCGALPSF